MILIIIPFLDYQPYTSYVNIAVQKSITEQLFRRSDE
jgi:hypothetical protein